MVDDMATDLIDANEAAQILGVTKNNLRQMVFHKKITIAERRGRKTFYDRSAVTVAASARKGS